MKVNLNGATAVITGASSGIGREFAKALAAKGCRLILVARREERMRELAAGLGVPCEVLPADLSRAEECNRIVGTIAGQGASVLINCAGFGLLGATTDQSLDEELNMIDLNIRAVHILTRKFLELRAQEGTGAILNVASCAGLLPAGPYLNTYYATKAYVASFTQGLAQELRDCKSGIYVGALCPGPVYTEFTKAAHGKEWSSAKTPEEIVAALQDAIPRVRASFVISQLDYLKRGGRCSSLAALGANVADTSAGATGRVIVRGSETIMILR